MSNVTRLSNSGASGLRDRTVAVTGAGGFIGSVVLRLLSERGADLRALLGPKNGDVTPAPGGVATAFADITDLRALRELVAGADTVVHLAGPPSVSASFDDPREYARVHVGGTATLLEACRGTGVRRLVHLSSAEVYAVPDHVAAVSEHDRVQARSPYGAAKLGAEEMVRAMAPVFGLEAVILRPFSAYGPGSPPRSLVGSLVRQALQSATISLADLTPVRDYCFVEDVAEAVVLAVDSPLPTLTRTYNVCSGRGVSVADLVSLVLSHAGRQLPVVRAPEADRPASATVAVLVGAPDRARRELGWHSTTSLSEGIARTVVWARGISSGA